MDLPLIALELGALAGLLTMKAGGGQEEANKVDDYIDHWLLQRKRENRGTPFPSSKPRTYRRAKPSPSTSRSSPHQEPPRPSSIVNLGLPPIDYNHQYMFKKRIPQVLRQSTSEEEDLSDFEPELAEINDRISDENLLKSLLYCCITNNTDAENHEEINNNN